MNIITSRGLKRSASLGAAGLFAIIAMLGALSMKAHAMTPLSCPSYLKVSAAATCNLEHKRSVGRTSVLEWKIDETDPLRADDGT